MSKITVIPVDKEYQHLRVLFEKLCALPQCIFLDKYLTDRVGHRNAVINMLSGQTVVLYHELGLFDAGRSGLALCVPPVIVGGDRTNPTYCDLTVDQASRIVELWTIQANQMRLNPPAPKDHLP